MRSSERLELIISQVENRGFVSVKELSELCQVNAMTIRRDLRELEGQKKIRRTHGGAASLNHTTFSSQEPASRESSSLADRLDVLIAAAPTTKYETLLPDSTGKHSVPLVAESTALSIGDTCVSVDNYKAGYELGVWAGRYALEHWRGKACLLDLTYHLANTQERSQGFLAGLRDTVPGAELILSVNTQSRYEMALQLTRDALAVHKNINIIFAMNDTSAMGAIHACEEMKIDPQQLIVLPFGVESQAMRRLIYQRGYAKAGLAMFPEIVGPVCVEAAIALWNRQEAPEVYITPHAVLTADTLPEFFSEDNSGGCLRWDRVREELTLPTELYLEETHPRKPSRKLPRRIGFIYTFIEHAWYHSLIDSMRAYTKHLGIDLEVVDVEQTLKDEIEWRRREIALGAAEKIRPGETISLDSGPICSYLAEVLRDTRKSVTVISNSWPVLETLREAPDVTLISTGGVFRRGSMNFVGPTAEATLREIRVDKHFLTVNGVSLGFGLSHSNLSEVTIKQAMIRSAREVILLADHTCFEQEALIQVAPVTALDRLITDDALPASVRLELSKLGIRVELASA